MVMDNGRDNVNPFSIDNIDLATTYVSRVARRVLPAAAGIYETCAIAACVTEKAPCEIAWVPAAAVAGGCTTWYLCREFVRYITNDLESDS